MVASYWVDVWEPQSRWDARDQLAKDWEALVPPEEISDKLCYTHSRRNLVTIGKIHGKTVWNLEKLIECSWLFIVFHCFFKELDFKELEIPGDSLMDIHQ